MSDEITVKHEYIDLTVNEISLVDKPANQKEFTVIKCLTTEDNEMSEESTKKTDSEETKDKGIEKVSTEVPETDNEDAKKVLNSINQLVNGIKKKLEEQIDTKKEDKEEEVKKEENPMRSFFLDTLKKNGAKEEEIVKSLKEFDEKFNKKEVKKEESEAKKEDKGEIDSDAIINGLSDIVQKAKTFTPKRQQALKQAIEKLSQLAQELSNPGQAPSDSKFGDSGVKKEDIEKSIGTYFNPIKESLEKVLEVTKSLAERVEKIEKIKPDSKSIGDDQTDSKVKKDTNIWSGLGL
jgi:DNA repair exonuclease SbcCD ATPase subunit